MDKTTQFELTYKTDGELAAGWYLAKRAAASDEIEWVRGPGSIDDIRTELRKHLRPDEKSVRAIIEQGIDRHVEGACRDYLHTRSGKSLEELEAAAARGRAARQKLGDRREQEHDVLVVHQDDEGRPDIEAPEGVTFETEEDYTLVIHTRRALDVVVIRDKGDRVTAAELRSSASGNITVSGDGPGDALRSGKGGGDAMRTGIGDGSATRTGAGTGSAVRDGHGAGDARREGSGAGDAIQRGEGDGSAIRCGTGKGDAWRGGEGRGHAIADSSGDGNAKVSGRATGTAIRSGRGDGNASLGDEATGNAVRDGSGDGNAYVGETAHGHAVVAGCARGTAVNGSRAPGDAANLSDDAGHAERNGAGEGHALRAGKGKGSAHRDGTGNGHAYRDMDGFGSAANTSKGHGNAMRDAGQPGEAVRRNGPGRAEPQYEGYETNPDPGWSTTNRTVRRALRTATETRDRSASAAREAGTDSPEAETAAQKRSRELRPTMHINPDITMQDPRQPAAAPGLAAEAARDTQPGVPAAYEH